MRTLPRSLPSSISVAFCQPALPVDSDLWQVSVCRRRCPRLLQRASTQLPPQAAPPPCKTEPFLANNYAGDQHRRCGVVLPFGAHPRNRFLKPSRRHIHTSQVVRALRSRSTRGATATSHRRIGHRMKGCFSQLLGFSACCRCLFHSYQLCKTASYSTAPQIVPQCRCRAC